jgi:Tol biopolymer transport system component
VSHDDDSESPPASVANVSLPLATARTESTGAAPPGLELFGPGTRIAGRYTVAQVLGSGGMGTVYRALDEELQEDVALKVLKGGAAELAYLRDEVRLAQKVTHPNVCRTFDLESDGTLQFIKMEYVPGELLAERIKRDSLPIPEVLRIARGIAAGLEAMHAQKIIHRDLKPGNVMLARDGRVVLMDFGLAHKLTSRDTGIAGTPGYMAPEQLLGKDLDERTDYYALGCVIFEMLAGERVYGTGSILEISDRHVDAPVPEVRGKRRDTPRTLARAVELLLAKQPDARPAGLALLAVRSRPWIAPLVAVALGVIAVSVVWVIRGGSSPWRPEVIDLPQAEESSDGAALSPDGTRIAWNSNRTDEQFRLYVANADGTGERRLPQDGSFDEPRWTRDGTYLLTSAKDQLVKVPLDGGAPILLGATGNSPDDCGTGVVFTRPAADGARLIYKPYDGAERELVRAYADEWLEKPRCDPSGTRVVFLRGMAPASAFGTDVYLTDLEEGKVTALTSDHNAGAATFAGDTVVFASRLADGKVQLLESTGRQLTFDDGPDSSPDVSRDGTTLLFLREVNLFSIYGGVRTDKPRKLSSRRESAYNLRVASPNGEILLAERAPGTILVIDTVAGTDRELAPGHLPFPSLDGKTVYFRAIDDPARLMAIPLAGGTAKPIATLPGRIVLGVDGPDGQHVMVDEPEHHLVSNRIGPDGTLTDEGAHWVVPAPHGGWRFWQRPGNDLELRVIAPGKPLGSMDCVFTVESQINQWLDDHHLAYLLTVDDRETWHVLDVRTCTDDKPRIETFDVGDNGLNAVLAPDGKHWFTTKSVSRVTRHLARNFASRPR